MDTAIINEITDSKILTMHAAVPTAAGQTITTVFESKIMDTSYADIVPTITVTTPKNVT